MGVTRNQKQNKNKTSHMHTSCLCPRKRMYSRRSIYHLSCYLPEDFHKPETTQGRIDSPRKLAETTHLPRPKRPTPKIGRNDPGRNDSGRNDPGPKRPGFP